MRRIKPCLVCLLLPACAALPTPEQAAQADYGRPHSAAECVALAAPTIAETLKDPSAAQFRHGPACERGYWSSAPLFGMPVAYGWLQRGLVNGKNAYGGYVGFRPYRALIRDGVVMRYCVTDHDGLCIPSGR